MRNIISVILCCTAALAQAQPVSYQQQIRPLLERYCTECHSGWFPKGGLRLDSLQHIHEGGANGAVLFAGEPDKGTLINLVRQVPGRFSSMPPGPAAVDPESFALLRRWIEQGAH